MNIFRNCSGQIYAEPHKSYESITHAGAGPISEADFSWACGVSVQVLNRYYMPLMEEE
jgi:hypothetical protein